MTKVVLICLYAIIICVAVLLIYRIRHKKVASGSAIEEAQNKDIIDDISNFRKKHLAAQPWNMKYEVYVTISTICAIVLAAAGYLYKGILWAIAGGCIGFLVPDIIVRVQSASQKQKFEERYSRALRQLSAALKSGMSLHYAVEDVCRSPFIHDDIRVEFQQLSADLKLGVSIQDAFVKFAERVQFHDADDVAIAMSMQAQVGGREGEVIEGIAKNIGDRMMLRKEINSMFSGSTMTVLAMDIIPFGVIGISLASENSFMNIYLNSPTHFVILIAVIVFMGIGSVVTHGMIANMKKECGIR